MRASCCRPRTQNPIDSRRRASAMAGANAGARSRVRVRTRSTSRLRSATNPIASTKLRARAESFTGSMCFNESSTAGSARRRLRSASSPINAASRTRSSPAETASESALSPAVGILPSIWAAVARSGAGPSHRMSCNGCVAPFASFPARESSDSAVRARAIASLPSSCGESLSSRARLRPTSVAVRLPGFSSSAARAVSVAPRTRASSSET